MAESEETRQKGYLIHFSGSCYRAGATRHIGIHMGREHCQGKGNNDAATCGNALGKLALLEGKRELAWPAVHHHDGDKVGSPGQHLDKARISLDAEHAGKKSAHHRIVLDKPGKVYHLQLADVHPASFVGSAGSNWQRSPLPRGSRRDR